MSHPLRIGPSLCAVSAVLGLALASGLASGQPGAPEKLRVALSAIGPGMGGLFMAKEGGHFRDQGLDVEFVFFASGLEGVQTLLSGQLPIVTAGGPAVTNAVLAGGDVAWIAVMLPTVPYALMVAPEITRPEDLRGKRLGINRFGASADFATRWVVAKLGLDPKRDVTLLQVGGRSTRLAALKSGGIDGAVMEPPDHLLARKLGFRELADTAALGLRYPYEAVATSRAYVRARPDVVRRFLRGLVLGTHHFKTRREDSIRAFAKYLKVDDAEALAETYAAYAPLVPAKPFPPADGIQLLLDLTEDPRARGAKPVDFVEVTLLRELDESGFIDRLYKP